MGPMISTKSPQTGCEPDAFPQEKDQRRRESANPSQSNRSNRFRTETVFRVVFPQTTRNSVRALHLLAKLMRRSYCIMDTPTGRKTSSYKSTFTPRSQAEKAHGEGTGTSFWRRDVGWISAAPSSREKPWFRYVIDTGNV